MLQVKGTEIVHFAKQIVRTSSKTFLKMGVPKTVWNQGKAKHKNEIIVIFLKDLLAPTQRKAKFFFGFIRLFQGGQADGPTRVVWVYHIAWWCVYLQMST